MMFRLLFCLKHVHDTRWLGSTVVDTKGVELNLYVLQVFLKGFSDI